jgi:DNA end-binding protein Ku
LSTDGSRLKQQYVRTSDGKVVEQNEKVQGYEFQKGQYVMFTPDELKAMNVEATNAIDIAEFIPLDDVERIFIEKVYYLGPDKGAARSYHLLRAALAKTKRAALAKYAARGKSYLVLIRAMGEGLAMEQLKHLDELRPFAEVPLDTVEVAPNELSLAIQIIEQRTNERFEPEKYTDEIRSRILELIQQKIDGREIAVPPEERPEAKIIDLMEALKASVAGGGAKTAVAANGGRARKPAQRASKKPEAATKKPAAAKQSGKRKSG